MKIKLINRKNIDDKRWNGCIHFAINALPYAYTWYLDNVCENWEGLVLDNYKAVMPLVYKKKFGISYLYQPAISQQHGVFTSLAITKPLINNFINTIPKKYKYIDINLNEINNISENENISELRNYHLHLNLDYALIKVNYSKSLKRKLNKANKNNLKITTHISPEEFVKFFIENTSKKISNFKDEYEHVFHRVIYKSLSHQLGEILGVKENNVLVSAIFILKHPTRIINLLPSSSTEGLKLNAMTFLLDYIIQKNANSKKIFDFEGSMIEGIERFYKSFGAEKTNYYRLKRNNLPFFLRIFKNN